MLKAANNAQSALAQAIDATATSFSVVDGSSFPTDNFLISADDEIMLVGARSGNTFSSVTRGHEGTTAAAHVSGTAVENRFTAGTYTQLADALLSHKAESASHVKPARIVVGTSTAGWTAADCDYLCDGTADQTEINNAIQALPATGGEIVILDGTYNITAKINVNKDNVSIVGNGKSTRLSKKWNDTDGTITVTSKYCSIRNIYFYGNDSQPLATNAGIYLSVGADSSIINNNWFENFECGIHVFSSHNSISSNVCHVLPTDGYGIILKSSSDNIIINNVCNGGYCGIYLDTSNNNTITGNTCNNNSNGNGISLSSSSSDNTITGNTCNNSNGNGISLSSSSSDNTITGNTCNNNNSNGISLSSSSNNTVTGNTCIRGTGTPEDYTTDQHTILLSGTSNNYNLISSNNCMGKAPVVEGGTGNTVFNNKWDATSDFEDLRTDVGDKTTLTTTDKTNLVNAVNETKAQINSLDEEVIAHKNDTMPHKVLNLKTKKTYCFGFRVSAEGKPQIIYEEAI